MIKRSDSNAPSDSIPARKRRGRPASGAVSKSRRRLLLEGLEQRQMMAGDVPTLPAGFVLPTFNGPRNIGTVQAFNATDNEPTNALGSNDSRQTAVFLPLGNGPGQQNTIDVNGTVPISVSDRGNVTTDVDFFAFDLQAGDILDVATINAVGTFNVLYNDGTLWFGTDSNVGIGHPDSSPLMTSGNAVAAQVVPASGRYFLQVLPSATGSAYTVGLRTYRPVAESLPIGSQQVLYLDFDGGIFPTSLFGLGTLPLGSARVSSLRQNLPLLGINTISDAAYDRMLDGIIAQVVGHFQTVATGGGNGNYNVTGVPGQFGITVLNSRDHADPGFDNPLVTRMIIGGLGSEFGIDGALGQAQSLDIGNFDMSENAVVPIDFFLAAANAFPISPSSSVLDAVVRRIGRTTTHEAAHTFGLRHTNGSNAIGDVIDDPGTTRDAFALGVGPDGIFGTADDIFGGFTTDQFSLNEGLFGSQRGAESMAWALSTGRVGGVVSGQVFNDLNRNGNAVGDPGLAGVTVFVDRNGNGVFDPSEPTTVTAAGGTFTLGIAPGTYNVIAVAPTGLSATTTLSRSVTVSQSSPASGVLFGMTTNSDSTTGRVFNDINDNGELDPGELPLPGVYVYADLDGDDRPDLGEPGVNSAIDGTYRLQFPRAGTYTVRVAPRPGLELTSPVSGEHVVTFNGVSTNGSNFNFGFLQALDFGDAAESYGVASHAIVAGLSLGATVDREAAALFSTAADGDDLDNTDDEDGVTITGPLAPGARASVDVFATNTTASPGYLNAWVDFNNDGVFGASEKIVTSRVLVAGRQTISFDVPANAVVGSTAARFRFSNDQNLNATGQSSSGEVEDYLFTISPTSNVAVDDTFDVPRNSEAFRLNVLANDFEVAGNELSIVNVNTAGVQGTVVVSGDRRAIFYSPQDGFLGRETLTYQVEDTFGNRSTATVVINVTFQSTLPVAIDDTFEVPQGSSNRPLNVLANDLASTSGGLTITSVTPGTSGGSVTVISGGQSLRYTPQPGFAGTEQFNYSIQDPAGNVSTATVTVSAIPGSLADDVVDFQFGLFSTVNTNQVVTDVQVGDRFDLTVFVDDLRSISFGDPEGVATAFLDVLYSSDLVAIVESAGIRYGDLFTGPGGGLGVNTFTQGSISTPGLIDEIGAVQSDISDLQSHSGRVPLFTITLQALSPGVATFIADPADDLVSETAVVGSDTALAINQLRLGTASLNISPAGPNFASAVDDAFPTTRNTAGDLVVATDSVGNPIVAGAAAPNRLNVLANDIFGPTGGIQEFNIEIAPGKGTATINTNGTTILSDDFVQYTPNLNASGFDSFTYSIVSGDGVRSTAEVTLTIGNVAASNFLVGMDMTFVNTSGVAVTSVNVGDVVGLQVTLDDLRNSFGDQTFVFAGFLDVLYSSNILTPITTAGTVPGADMGLGFAVSFGTNIDRNAASGFIGRNGIIDEFGSNDIRGGVSSVVGEDPRNLATIYFRATAAGTATAVGSPADSFPFRDTLLFDRDTPVGVDQILFDRATLTVGAGSGEAPRQNQNLAADVNNDGFVTSIDALLIINELNRSGRVSAQGEAAAVPSGYFTDVNGDNRITASDALNVINYLNRQTRGVRTSVASGEAPAAGAIVPVPASVVSNASSAVSAVRQDAVFAGLDDDDAIIGGSAVQDPLAAAPVLIASVVDGDDDDDDVLGLLADDQSAL